VGEAVISHSARVKHHGKLYAVDIPEFRVLRCDGCGALVFNEDADEQINEALRKKLGLLQPAEIRAARVSLGWSQEQLAKAVQAARATVNRWEKGVLIQSRRSDQALRSCLPRETVAEPASLVGELTRARTDDLENEVRRYIDSIASKVLQMRPDRASRKSLLDSLAGREIELAEWIDLMAGLGAKDAGQCIKEPIATRKLRFPKEADNWVPGFPEQAWREIESLVIVNRLCDNQNEADDWSKAISSHARPRIVPSLVRPYRESKSGSNLPQGSRIQKSRTPGRRDSSRG
jgi:DNA-binding XRE family transcriptional regulator